MQPNNWGFSHLVTCMIAKRGLIREYTDYGLKRICQAESGGAVEADKGDACRKAGEKECVFAFFKTGGAAGCQAGMVGIVTVYEPDSEAWMDHYTAGWGRLSIPDTKNSCCHFGFIILAFEGCW